MMTGLKAGAAAVGVMAVLGGAAAARAAPSAVTPIATYDIGTVMPGAIYSSSTGPIAPGGQTSTYDFTFNIEQPYGTTASGNFQINMSAKDDISDADLELFSGSPASPADLNSAMYITGVEYSPDSGTAQSLNATLDAGNYFVQATVKVPAGSQGPFNIGASVRSISKAPEPSTWLLMMLGVGGLGVAMRRRRGTELLARV